MSQRKDLFDICETLQIPVSQNEDDVALLRSINQALDKLDLTNVPDSLSFPEETRKTCNLNKDIEFWNKLGVINNSLRQDHVSRRKMLINRLDCTIKSFKRKESQGNSKIQALNAKIQETYDEARKELKVEPQINLEHLLALRETDCDRLLNCIVSSSDIDCKIAYGSRKGGREAGDKSTNLKQVIIPNVPDRGGRPNETRPPRDKFHKQRKFY